MLIQPQDVHKLNKKLLFLYKGRLVKFMGCLISEFNMIPRFPWGKCSVMQYIFHALVAFLHQWCCRDM